ncbi:MAG: HAD family hydrolase [Spirochaetes bacterium]|nr:MAG: HAD family hydrolase [Spirochaetota bacterium]
MKIDGVIFDVDGTLYPVTSMYLHSIAFFLENLELVYHFGKVRKRIRELPPVRNFKKLQAQMLADSMGISVERAYRLIEKKIYEEWEKRLKGIRAFSYIRPSLKLIRSYGLKLGVLSDFPVKRKLTYLNLENYWDCACSSEVSGCLKPNPEPFLFVAEKLKVKPERTLYVGNSYEYDVLGASCAGMKSAHLVRMGRKNSKADFTFSSYRDFLKILERNIK